MKFFNEMTLTVKAVSQNESFARSVVAGFFAQLNPTVEEVDDLKTVVSEAVTNSIVHGYDNTHGKIDVWAGLAEDCIHVKIIDYGRGIEDVTKAMQPFFTTGEERSGMGFTVMDAFSDSLEVTSKKGFTCVYVVKHLRGEK